MRRPGLRRTGGRRGLPLVLLPACVGAGLVAVASPGRAQGLSGSGSPLSALATLGEPDFFYLAALALVLGVGFIVTAMFIKRRAQLVADNARLAGRLAMAERETAIRTALIAEAGERILIYSGEDRPEIIGSLPAAMEAPDDETRFLAFGEWLPKEVAGALTAAVDRLRVCAEPFRTVIDRPDGSVVEVSGQTVGGSALVRFTALEGIRSEVQALEKRCLAARANVESLRNLFDAAPLPAWQRDATGRLIWVNDAYGAAVEADSPQTAVADQAEFLSAADRQRLAASAAADGSVSDTVSTVVSADRRQFNVVEAAGPSGTAGLAIDVAETEQVRMELRQTIDSQAETLDQLHTAVARFDTDLHLTYYNAAMQQLFDLSTDYLRSEPDHLGLLDHLRTRGILPTEKFLSSETRDNDLAAYRATEPTETMWHLTDGRTLRVIATPQPRGGATWIFEDITEKLELESQVRATVQLQRETIDYLSEAVAVFGSDGRLRLSNPAFADMFGLDPDFLEARPRVHTFPDTADVTIGPAGNQDGGAIVGWAPFAQAITAFDEMDRRSQDGEIELSSGVTAAYTIVPLPNGQTMLTFSDISDARGAERMLREKNEALETADRVKSDFVQHVNYELRSPLTNIIGFTALLRSDESGPLSQRQSEYLDYISTSTNSLLTIVNDILDLATIDAGIMELQLRQVDIAETVEHAAQGVRERVGESEIGLDIDLSRAGETFPADPDRLTQILFNLLSNAANFSPAGGRIALTVVRHEQTIDFTVRDQGPGISADQRERMFERFEANPAGGRHSGAGLGLSIVKSFVDLHGGTIAVRSEKGEGTTVTCIFPLRPDDPGRQGKTDRVEPATTRAHAA